MKGLKGNKRRGTHTTAIMASERLIRLIQKHPKLEKIRLGEIKVGSRPNGEKRIKTTLCDNGIHLQVKDGTSIQTLTFFTNDIQDLMIAIKEICKSEHFILTDQTI